MDDADTLIVAPPTFVQGRLGDDEDVQRGHDEEDDREDESDRNKARVRQYPIHANTPLATTGPSKLVYKWLLENLWKIYRFA